MSPPLIAGPIAVIDVETTGLFPFRHDRVVEVAAVVVRADGRIEREFVSLVNPARDIGPSSIHGLTSEDILHAPQFAEIAALLLDVLSGSVAIAAHNVRFDRQFLESEFSRLECQLPDCFSICTMQLAGGGRLADCCRDYGISPEGDAHHGPSRARVARAFRRQYDDDVFARAEPRRAGRSQSVRPAVTAERRVSRESLRLTAPGSPHTFQSQPIHATAIAASVGLGVFQGSLQPAAANHTVCSQPHPSLHHRNPA